MFPENWIASPTAWARKDVLFCLMQQSRPALGAVRDDSKQRCFSQYIAMLCLLFGILLLSSCSSVHRKDGPPNFYVDASRIHDAVPKIEPLSKYGNMASYRVFGKRYYTSKKSTHYNQVGVASWYGMQFHNHSTSSGEPYNVLAMTAAHKTLPLPTYVEVTNLANQRKIIVKVNDRGPFESNRLIDLSYVAAKKIGMLGHGTALVRVRAINLMADNTEHPVLRNNHRPMWQSHDFENSQHFANAESSRSTKNIRLAITERHHATQNNIYLDVGTFTNKAYAIRLKKHLIPIIHAPVTMTAHNTQRKNTHLAHHISHNQLVQLTRYHIQVGPIKNIAEANQIQMRLKHLGLQ